VGFRAAGSSVTVEVRGGSRVVKVREYRTYATPSQTFFQFRRDVKPALSLATINSVREQLSDRIEQVLALDDVVDVDYFQDTTKAGRLQDWMRTYYETDDGIEGDVESDLAHFGPNFTGNQVRQAIAIARALE
jgi:hypothetical protein